MSRLTRLASTSLLMGATLLTLSGCDLGGKTSVQRGYRGTGMEMLVDDSEHEAKLAVIDIPEPLPPSPPPSAGPLPWKNVQVLNDISVAELNRTMIAFTNWVAGTGNCAYCHNLRDLSADTTETGAPIYTKLVARRMIQMNRQVNGQYSQHVANTGVTCYTCHRGKPLPPGLWFYGKETDYLRHYLDRDGARVVTQAVAPSNANRSSVKQTEWTYALMISQSTSLGVGCTYCHNSRQFSSWEQSPPQRVVAYHGILMLRDLNQNYLSPLQTVFPAARLGPMGDAPKAQCSTCHQGAYKPLYAAQMVKDYPALWGRPAWNGAPFPPMSAPAPVPAVDGAAAAPAATPGAASATGAATGASASAAAIQPATAPVVQRTSGTPDAH
jgi:photosynthetic reaction center cytochrome c subunit